VWGELGYESWGGRDDDPYSHPTPEEKSLKTAKTAWFLEPQLPGPDASTAFDTRAAVGA
jgi:hypothetical protein